MTIEAPFTVGVEEEYLLVDRRRAGWSSSRRTGLQLRARCATRNQRGRAGISAANQ
jgi:hypothetical protein